MPGNEKKRLNENERLDIIAKLSRPNPPSKRTVAREYNVNEKAIRKIWKNRASIEERSSAMSVTEREATRHYRPSVGKFSEIETRLYSWIDAMRQANLTVGPSLCIVKAKQIAAELSIPEDDFKASLQWLRCFRARKGLQDVLLHGEGGEVDKNDPDLLAQLYILYDTIKEYNPECVYNMDETGLFFRQLPRCTLLMPNEDISSVCGAKKVKDRVSLVVCANATGSHKMPCTLIGKSKSPACIKNRIWPVPYFSQPKAGMDKNICWKWFREVFHPEVRRRTAGRILLLLDNAPGHFEAFEYDNIRVFLFPQNCPRWKQPCNHGIIAALKKRVKYLYLVDVLAFHSLDEAVKEHKRSQIGRLPRGSAGVAFGNPAHLLDAATYVKKAWDAITPLTISNAFKKAEIMGEEYQIREESDHENEETDKMFADLVRDLSALDVTISQEELDAFINIDNEDSLEFANAISEDANDLLNSQGAENPANDDNSDEVTEEVQASDEDQATFVGFDTLLEQMLSLEDQLLSEEFKNKAGVQYDQIMHSFESFEKKLRGLAMDVKCRQVAQRR